MTKTYSCKQVSTLLVLLVLHLLPVKGLDSSHRQQQQQHPQDQQQQEQEFDDHHIIQASWEGLFQGDLKFEHDDNHYNYNNNITKNDNNNNHDNDNNPSDYFNTTTTATTHRSLNSANLVKWDNFLKNDYYWIRVYIDNSYTAYETSIIQNALSSLQWTAKVIRIQYLSSKPGNNNRNPYLHIQKSNGCWSYYGRRSDAHLGQPLSLDTPCLTRQRTIHHVFLHALGFGHEINRPDRDNFVSINYDNIMSGYEDEFAIMEDINTLGVPFDYKSVMMFGPNTFSKASWLKTIESKTRTAIDTSMDGASWWDYIQIRLMYQCTAGGTSGATSRTFAQYRNQKCNWNCQCWKKTSGCNGGGDGWCKGDLVCRQNVCVDP